MFHDRNPYTPLQLSFAGVLILSGLGGLGISAPSISVNAALYVLVIALGYILDRASFGHGGRLGRASLVMGCAFGLWLIALSFTSLVNGSMSPDTAVIVIPAVIPLLLAASLGLRLGTDGLMPLGAPALRVAASFWVATAILDALTAEVGSPLQFLSHERTFIAVAIVSMPGAGAFLLARVGAGAAVLLSLSIYPSATSLAVILIACLVAVLLRIRSRTWRLVGAGIAATVSAVLLGATDTIGRLYIVMGRVNNSETREALWAQALTVIDSNLLVGGAVSMQISGTFERYGRVLQVPIHNTWLTLGVAGGVIAIAAFAATVGFAVLAGITAAQARWLPALAGAVVTLSVNPTLDRPDTAAAFWVLVCSAMVISQNNGTKSPKPWN